MKKFFLLIILLTISSIGFGQHPDNDQPQENWFLDYGFRESPVIYHRYDNYSKADIFQFREKMEALKTVRTSDEWEGRYVAGGDHFTSFSQLRWNAKAGFISFYIDTCTPELRDINYGDVVNTPEYLLLTPIVIDGSPRKITPVKYIKVKWASWHYLVAEDALPAFAEKAVGLYVVKPAPGKYAWENYWAVTDDFEAPLTGSPVFPGAYKKFARRPIEAKIIFVGKRAIKREFGTGKAYYTADTAFYNVTINAGKNSGVKKEMMFGIEATGEEIYITKVNQKTAVGIIARGLNDDKSEICRDDNSNKIQCPAIKNFLSVKTQLGKFWP